MTHFVIDAETLSLAPNAHMLSLGIVALYADGTRGHAYWVIDQSLPQHNRHIDAMTVAWWQSEKVTQAARDAIWKPDRPTVDVETMLQQLRMFINAHDDGNPERAVWGNGPEADCVWLKTLHKALHLPLPWNFYEQQSIRTLKLLLPDCADVGEFKGIKHHALDDALHEAKMVQKWLLHTAIKRGLARIGVDVKQWHTSDCMRCHGKGCTHCDWVGTV